MSFYYTLVREDDVALIYLLRFMEAYSVCRSKSVFGRVM